MRLSREEKRYAKRMLRAAKGWGMGGDSEQRAVSGS